MGTRSIIKFVEKYDYDKEYELVTIYQQYDGYLEGVGRELAQWLSDKEIINGIGLGDNTNRANGVGCLAAQFIKEFKREIGGLYIYPSDAKPQDFNYRVVVDGTGKADDVIKITVTRYDDKEPIFVGTPSELLALSKREEN